MMGTFALARLAVCYSDHLSDQSRDFRRTHPSGGLVPQRRGKRRQQLVPLAAPIGIQSQRRRAESLLITGTAGCNP